MQATMAPCRISGRLRQVLVGFAASLGMWSLGAMGAFPSVMAFDLHRHNTTLYGTFISLSDTQLDLLSSVPALTSLLGVVCVVPIMGRLGRRASMVTMALFVVAHWLCVAFAPSFLVILVGRILSGVGAGGLSIVLNVYSVEVADKHTRGIINYVLSVGVLCGTLFMMAVGYDTRYFWIAFWSLGLIAAFLLVVLWLPESPSFLVVSGREEEAERVLWRLREKDDDELQAEMMLCREMNLVTGGTWRALLHPSVLRPMGVVIALTTISVWSGNAVMLSNVSRFFHEAGSSVSENLASLVVALILVLGMLLSMALVDTIGRKKSLIVSATTYSLALFAMAAYTRLEYGAAEAAQLGWMPLVFLTVAQLGSVLGIVPAPFLLMSELFPTRVRTQASSVITVVRTMMNVAAFQLYTPMLHALTQPGLYLFYASVTVLAVPVTVFCLQETMGKAIG